MRSRLAAATVLCLLAAILAPASARATSTGTIKGRVVNGATGEPQSGVEVTLRGGRRSISGDVTQMLKRKLVTGRDGRYSFGDLRAGDRFVYSVDAGFRGGFFPSSAITIPGDTSKDPVLDTTLRVWDTTADPEAIVIRRDDIFLLKGDRGLNVIESFKIVNVSEQAYIGRGAAMAPDAAGGTLPTLSFSFPPQAMEQGVQILDSTIDIPRLIRTSTGIGVTVAIPPTTQQDPTSITFAYNVTGATGQFDLSRRANYPTLEFSVFAEPPFAVDSNKLTQREDVQIRGDTYRKYTTTDLIEAADSLQIVATARAEGDSTLIAGAVVGGTIILLLLGVALVARLRRRKQPTPERPVARPDREQLLVAIAELDLAYRAGDLGEDEWIDRRSRLKAKLARLKRKQPEPAR